MVRDEAMSYLESYIGGGVTSSDANLKSAIAYLAANYGSTVPKWNVTVNGKSSDRFDAEIGAFSYFWDSKYSSKGYQYQMKYIKAVMAVESKIGIGSGTNASTDVMQCLESYDPAVYCMAKIEPSNGTPYDPNEGLTKGMLKGGYKAVRNIFSGSIPQASKYNSTLSICFGILWLGYKTAVKGSIKAGVIAYNGNGDSDYWEKITECLANPGSFLRS